MMGGLNIIFKVYLVVAATYGTVYLSCLVVPKPVEDALWWFTVDNFAGQTFGLAALVGAVWAWQENRR